MMIIWWWPDPLPIFFLVNCKKIWNLYIYSYYLFFAHKNLLKKWLLLWRLHGLMLLRIRMIIMRIGWLYGYGYSACFYFFQKSDVSTDLYKYIIMNTRIPSQKRWSSRERDRDLYVHFLHYYARMYLLKKRGK